MATYPATNDLAALDATQPTGSEDAGKVDDVLRETRLTMKSVITLAHSTKGEVRCALWAQIDAGAQSPAPTGANAWHARTAYTRLANVGGLDTSNSPSVFIPVAGTYIILADALGYQIDRTQIRLFNVTDNIAVPNCTGNNVIAGSSNSLLITATATLMGIFTTSGTKTFRLEQAHQTNNTANGWGITGGTWPDVQFRSSQVLMIKIG